MEINSQFPTPNSQGADPGRLPASADPVSMLTRYEVNDLVEANKPAVPGIVKTAVILTFFNTWVLFEETIVDRYGLWQYMPYYRVQAVFVGHWCACADRVGNTLDVPAIQAIDCRIARVVIGSA